MNTEEHKHQPPGLLQDQAGSDVVIRKAQPQLRVTYSQDRNAEPGAPRESSPTDQEDGPDKLQLFITK